MVVRHSPPAFLDYNLFWILPIRVTDSYRATSFPTPNVLLIFLEQLSAIILFLSQVELFPAHKLQGPIET